MDRVQIERNNTVLCFEFGVIDAGAPEGHTDVSYCLSCQTLPPVDSIGPHTSLHHINPQPKLWVRIGPVFPRRTVAVTPPSF